MNPKPSSPLGEEATKRSLEVLLELTGRYAETVDIEELLHDVTRRLAEEINIDRAALVAVDDALDAGYIVAASDDADINDVRLDLERYPEVKQAARTLKPVIVEDAPSHPLLEGLHATVAARGIQNIAALPLVSGGRALGVLLLRRSAQRGVFTDSEIEFLKTVAHATAVALRNARRLEKLRGQSEREKNARIAAEERAARYARYEAYFRHLSDGIAILDDNFVVLSMNPAAFDLLDLTQEFAVGKPLLYLANVPAPDELTRSLQALQTGQAQSSVDVEVETVRGKKLTLSVSMAPVREFEAAFVVTLRDITERRRLENELRETKGFLANLIDSSVDAIIVADRKGQIILFNKGAELITGYSHEEAFRLSVHDLYPAGQAREIMAKLRSPDFGGEGRLSPSRLYILDSTQQQIPVNMTAAILYEDGVEIGSMGIFTDLRERMALEQKLSVAETRLEESERNAVVVALAGAAAHELNQPLTSVLGYTELLLRRVGRDVPESGPLEAIHRDALRMTDIIKKLGKVTKFETKAYVGGKRIVDFDKSSAR